MNHPNITTACLFIFISTLSLCYLLASSCNRTTNGSPIGINYGRLGNNLPSVYQSIQHIKSLNTSHVKLYDANSEILKLLSGTKLRVVIMVPNDQISSIASHQVLADKWVRENVMPYYPGTKVRFLLVGNEVLSYDNKEMWHALVPAMRRILKALRQNNVHNIKVGTTVAMDIMERTFPPSSGQFRSNIVLEVIQPLLKFLNGTNSFFFLDVYTYFPWSANPSDINLDFALLRDDKNVTKYKDPHSGLIYSNLLDQMLDSVASAMSKLGYEDIKIAIAETGWPHAGDIDQPGANAYNAETYNRNLITKMTAYPTLGTPARPGVNILTFIFSLYDENQKPGQGTERHWGLVDNKGHPFYKLDFTGRSMHTHLPEPKSSKPYKGKIWCVAAKGTKEEELAPALDFACGHGNQTCSELAPGRPCYQPLSIFSHSSYAFSSYWARFRSTGASCFFNGVAVQTTTDPSHGSCKFPSVTV